MCARGGNWFPTGGPPSPPPPHNMRAHGLECHVFVSVHEPGWSLCNSPCSSTFLGWVWVENGIQDCSHHWFQLPATLFPPWLEVGERESEKSQLEIHIHDLYTAVCVRSSGVIFYLWVHWQQSTQMLSCMGISYMWQYRTLEVDGGLGRYGEIFSRSPLPLCLDLRPSGLAFGKVLFSLCSAVHWSQLCVSEERGEKTTGRGSFQQWCWVCFCGLA